MRKALRGASSIAARHQCSVAVNVVRSAAPFPAGPKLLPHTGSAPAVVARTIPKALGNDAFFGAANKFAGEHMFSLRISLQHTIMPLW